MSRPRVTVVGSVNFDYSMRVPALPRGGETLTGHDFDICLGGKGANQAVAAARLGAETRLIACVGDDAGGARALDAFAEDGLDTSGIGLDPQATTGSALIFVDDNGENCIGVNRGANGALTPAHVDAHREALTTADIVLLQLEIPFESVLHAAAMARAAGRRVILNPAPLRGPLKSELYANVDVLTPNAHEAARLANMAVDCPETAERAARVIRAQGPDVVVITLGRHGAVALNGDGALHVPAPAVDAIDTVGAGDTFNGALAVALAEGRTLAEAIRFANAAAAIAVTRRGAQPAVPRRDEVQA